MLPKVCSRQIAILLLAFGITWNPARIAAAEQLGGFLAVLNTQRFNGDSRMAVSYFSTSDLSQPLFSVYVGREPLGSTD